jgi:inorganic pyrophosphatase
MSKNFASGINSLTPFNKETGELNAVIETPKGSRNRYEFDERKEFFKLSEILSLGGSFPFDFGFIPQTLGENGDPLDVLLLMDEAAFPGCLVESRLIGSIIKANQTEDGKAVRNDRLLAVASKSLLYASIKSIKDLDKNLVEQIKHFLFLITKRKRLMSTNWRVKNRIFCFF